MNNLNIIEGYKSGGGVGGEESLSDLFKIILKQGVCKGKSYL